MGRESSGITYHHTLVITKEEDGQATNAVDGYEKFALLKLVHHIPARYLIHGDVCPMGLIKLGLMRVTGRPNALQRVLSKERMCKEG